MRHYVTELDLRGIIKAYEIVEAENPSGDYQTKRLTVLSYLRRVLIDELASLACRFGETK